MGWDIGYPVSAGNTETTNINGIVVAIADEDAEEKEISEIPVTPMNPLNPPGDSGAAMIFSISQIVTFLAFFML